MIFIKACKTEFCSAVYGDKKVEFALFGVNLRDVYVEVAGRICFEFFAFFGIFFYARELVDAMSFV